MNTEYDVKFLAEAGYTMGLQTIREVASHMECHHYAYFNIDTLGTDIERMYANLGTKIEDKVSDHVTPERMAEMDAEMDKVLNAPEGLFPTMNESDFKAIFGDDSKV